MWSARDVAVLNERRHCVHGCLGLLSWGAREELLHALLLVLLLQPVGLSRQAKVCGKKDSSE